jgi:hypothetical protein
MTAAAEPAVPELPPFSLDVQALNLGTDTKAVGLELLGTESREPVRGPDAANIWSAVFPALAAGEPYVLDFFSHVDRVRDFCNTRGVSFREAADRCLVISQPPANVLLDIFERFEKETFGVRSGKADQLHDPALEGELSRRGLDAYEAAYLRYTFCAVCEPEDGWVTLLSAALWPSEIIRRVRPAVQAYDVYIARPQ